MALRLMRPNRRAAHVLIVTTSFITLTALCGRTPADARDENAAVRSVVPIAAEAYRYFHRFPELGKAEVKTQTYIIESLTPLGQLTFVPSVRAPTAVIAVLDTGRPGPVIALRAEMDARKLDPDVTEPANHDPRSEIDGLMHNCGHDLHSAVLLATAHHIVANKQRFAGKIVSFFQPAEETAGGADDIVNEGILANLGVEKIFALHSAPTMKVGTIAISAGPTLAGSSYFSLKLHGRGSHAAAPYEGDDLPVLATQFVQALSTFPARRTDIANRPLVISVTKLVAQSSVSNVLPESAEIAGTIRAFEDIEQAPPQGKAIATVLFEMVDALAKAHGITAEWQIRRGAPGTINHQQLFDAVVPALRRSWPGQLDTRPWRGMFSEDFAYYTSKLPALYFSLGIAKDGLGDAGVHTARFTAHPDSLPQGILVMTSLARIVAGNEQ